MKTNHLRLAASTLLGVALLAACGGGDDDLRGSLTSFSVTPDTATLTGPAGLCPGGTTGQDILIVGGTPPYRIYSSLNTLSAECAAAGASCGLTASTAQVDSQPGVFNIIYGGGCFTATISVVDYHGRKADVEVTAEEGQ
jgi:hypothetical protein